MNILRPVDSTILFFQRDLVIVMILKLFLTYARESNRNHLLTILKPFSNNGLIRFFSRTHKSRLRKITIERCVVWEAIKTEAQTQNLWSLENQTNVTEYAFSRKSKQRYERCKQ